MTAPQRPTTKQPQPTVQQPPIGQVPKLEVPVAADVLVVEKNILLVVECWESTLV
ncbi:MAG: hypothetical protein R2788_25500 [Saprospiraceae bacterium]